MKKIIILLAFFVFNIAKGQNFTDTKGELQISNSGQASYNLPIATPPSIKNVAPVINLAYTSGAIGGIAGQGWHINSISNISRIATRKDIDGFVDGVDFDDNDKLALDGQRLILKSGTYWADGSTYDTEFKSNVKIELLVQGQGTYFVVTTPDGSRSWYGSTGSGSVIASLNAWYIVRFEDVYGNYISYNYENTPYTGSYQSSYGAISYVATNQYYIKDIQFSGNVSAGVSLTNKIEFNYRSNPLKRRERAFVKGQFSYAFQILDNIKVYTGGAVFRKYQLTHIADPVLGYERLKQIQEFNGAGEPSNPVVFTYNTTPDISSSISTFYENNLLTKDIKVSGDFDGDGKIDFITSNYMYKNLFIGGTSIPPLVLPAIADDRRWFAASTLSNNKLNQFQSLVLASESVSAINFKVYNSPNNSIDLSYTKTIAIDNSIFHNTALDQFVSYSNDHPGPGYNYCYNPTIKPGTKYYEGDYNGDGLSEVLIVSKKNQSYFNFARFVNSTSNDNDAFYCESVFSDTGTDFYLLNLDPNGSTALGSKDYVKLENADALKGGKLYAMDFNGDGKADILSLFPDYTYKVVGFKQLTTAPWVEIEILGYGSMPNYAADKTILFGDYNGDGKTDVMVPEAIDNSNWYVYYANPKVNGAGAFFHREMYSNMLIYQPQEHQEYITQSIYNEYYAADINKDGKTDLVKFHKRSYEQGGWDYNSWDSEYYYQVMVNNIGNPGQGNTFTDYFVSPTYHSGIGTLPVTIGANPKFLGLNQDFVMLWNQNQLHYITFAKDVRKDNQITKISEAGDAIVHTIDYKQMIAPYGGLGTITDFYSSANTSVYPFVEMIKSDSYLVSKHTATINGISKYQSFKYRGFVVNLSGIGAIGFNRTGRSSWYLNESDPKIWTVQNNDAILRGANTITWSNTNEATVFAPEPDNLLNKKTNVFLTSTTPLGVYNVLLDSQTTLDSKTDVSINTKYTYDPDGYGLETKSITQNLLGTVVQGTTTVDTQYDNNPTGGGNTYYIGRPKQINNSTTVYPGAADTDTTTSEEKLTYNNFNLTKTEKKGHLTDAIVTEMSYDAVGNMLTKTVSVPTAFPAVASRTIVDEYEPTMRFVKKKTDHQGFVTLLEYNGAGQLKKSTDYFGVVNNFNYDNWGKLTSSITAGASINPKTIIYTYVKNSDGGYSVEQNTSETHEMSKTYYNVLGNVIKTNTKGFADNSIISQDVEYDGLGRKYRESEPYFSNPKYTTYYYDELHRPIKITSPTGGLQTFDYSGGLKTSAVDNGKASSATLDAIGNKMETSDPGGIIKYTYYAGGELRKTIYEDHEIKIEINGWGNKISMFDPNAGDVPYLYDYDAFGQLKRETTPKGYTEYTYDNYGKLTNKKVLGDGTDFNTAYTYNAFAQIETEISTTAGGLPIDNFAYTYDSFHRLSSTAENNINLEKTKVITYDSDGRPDIETNYTREKISNFSSTVKHQYNYNAYNGIMYKITDPAGGTIFWKLNSANEKMQVLTAELGNGINITNQYSDFYFTSQRHTKNTTNILYNTYTFDSVKGNLLKRQNVALGLIEETFTYGTDNLDRLTSWTNINTGISDYNIYDNKGRITVNNQLGKYNYKTAAGSGIYQKTNVKLNALGIPYYAELGGTQTVSYTMFKSPISINESNKGKINFEYNSHLSRSKMEYDYGLIYPGTQKEYRKTKLYSDDGTSEVIYNHAANTITIRSFIGGDAYSAVVYNERTLNQSTGVSTEANYYLHRDYLGSILAISNSSGNAVEKRHFDAWGNLAKIVDATGTSLPVANGLQFFDRGYTSHEHLQEVRLIHMNGRLYDPVLRSFLMPDNFVQDSNNTQNYNRYSYVLNNPLKYSDPSGEELVAAIIIGAAIAVAAYLVTNYVTDQPITCGGVLKSATIGAVSAAVTFGIGTLAEYCFSNFYSIAAASAVGHGLFQGGMSSISGGSFWTGAAAGAISSIAASAWGADLNGKSAGLGWAGNVRARDVGMIAFGAVSGGGASVIGGGNFWEGAAIGLTVSWLNHAMHKMSQEKVDSEVNVLLDTEGASGHGHAAMLAGNDKKGWRFVSKEGRAADNSSDGQDGTMLTGGKSAILDLPYNTKAEALSNHPLYDRVLTYKTTYSTAMRAINATYRSALSSYHVLLANCGHAVADGLSAIGYYSGSAMEPKVRYEQILRYNNNNHTPLNSSGMMLFPRN